MVIYVPPNFNLPPEVDFIFAILYLLVVLFYPTLIAIRIVQALRAIIREIRKTDY